MNISQLAELLEISPTTVSRVLTGQAEKYRISKITTERVRSAAAEHSVTPDPIASGLRGGKTGLIGLLVPDVTNPFFAQLARAIERELRYLGCAVLLSDSNESAETEAELLQVMTARRIDGLLLAPVGISSEILRQVIASKKMPMILLDRIIPELDAPSISLNNREAGRLAAEHLIAGGHQRIGCLRGAPDSHPDQQRLAGVCDALRDARIDVNETLFVGSGYSKEACMEAAKSILNRQEGSRPTALITLAGQGTLSVLEIAREVGLRIPDDISLVAFDEQPWSAFVEPPLTTIAQPVAEMAKTAVQMLIGPILDNSQHVLSGSLKSRSSVSNLS